MPTTLDQFLTMLAESERLIAHAKATFLAEEHGGYMSRAALGSIMQNSKNIASWVESAFEGMGVKLRDGELPQLLKPVFSLCLKQQERFGKWVAWLNEKHGAEAGEEDCSMMSPFTWKLVKNGIGDCITVTGFDSTLNLTMDDDGEFVTTAPWDK